MGVAKSQKGSGQGPSARIFIVDDEPMLLELAESILTALNYEVQTFSNPEKALAAYSAAQPPPDLIITDFAMHEMDGLALIRQCRRIHPKQKILLVSGTVDEEVFYTADAKPDVFLAKPYPPGKLAAIVQGVLTH